MQRYYRTVVLAFLLCCALSLLVAVKLTQSSSLQTGFAAGTGAQWFEASLGAVSKGGVFYFPQARLELALPGAPLGQPAEGLISDEESVIEEAVKAQEGAAGEDSDGELSPGLMALTGGGGVDEAFGIDDDNNRFFTPTLIAAGLIAGGGALALLSSDSGGSSASSNSGSVSEGLTGGGDDPIDDGGDNDGGGGDGGDGNGGGGAGGDEDGDRQLPPSTPEPSTLALLGMGLAWLFKRRACVVRPGGRSR
ncbi:MAG: PEP-CTERM sorting domain-containing protein [Candidatus Omnitrophica bacterium]|nr:PEP-CTERM sorting domain-containing protein [Candidatus Omnitrophota bacterium]